MRLVLRDWNSVLSLEEQRLIGLAHLLLAAPRFAVLADPDAGVGPERAAEVLGALTERGIGYIVLSHGSMSHVEFDRIIEVAPDGTWNSRVEAHDRRTQAT